MKEFNTGAVREDKTGKGRCDLLPMCALIRLSKHYENGSADHGERNWEKGLPMHSFLDSAIRHLFKYMDGQTDEDHLCAAAWNILGAMWTEEKKPEMQDIPTRLRVVSDNGTCRLLEPKPSNVVYHNQLCPYYDPDDKRCNGTKERDLCSCDGITTKCDR